MENSYTIILKGLTCENCGEKIRLDTEKLSEITSAKMNVLAQKMTVYTDKSPNEFIDKIKAIVKSYEPNVVVSLNSSNHIQEDTSFKYDLLKIIIGGILLLLGYLIKGNLGLGLLIVSYIVLGYRVIINGVKGLFLGSAMDENLLMSIATIGAFIINEPSEAVFVMLFYDIGEFFQELAVTRSRASIKSLLELCPQTANIEIDGKITVVSPNEVKIGDVLVIKPGEKVPLDCIVISGASELDYSALTGEVRPFLAEKGVEILNGSINNNGVLRAKAIRSFEDSTVSKILELVENASDNKAPSEDFIRKFAKIYTPIVVGLAFIIGLIIPLILGESIKTWGYSALVFLVVSCPCALVLSVPLAYFSGIGEASRYGILIRGSGIVKAITEADTVVLDKTGTITKGSFKVFKTIVADNATVDELIRYGGIAEFLSPHPLAKAITNYTNTKSNEGFEITEIPGRGVKAVNDKNTILAGNYRLFIENNISVPECSEYGSIIYVSYNNRYIGCFCLADEIKPESKATIKSLKKMDMKVIMLTGDNEVFANGVANELSIDYKAEMMPKDKSGFIEELCRLGKKPIFVGDGINDAPALALAHVGMAMGKRGSDAAIEASDSVIMNDELDKIWDAIKISKKTEAIVKENIVFAISVKVIILILSVFHLAAMNLAVFADVGVALIAVLNSMRKKL